MRKTGYHSAINLLLMAIYIMPIMAYGLEILLPTKKPVHPLRVNSAPWLHTYESVDTVRQYNKTERIGRTISGRKTAVIKNKKVTAGSAK
jgi:hypothetical protein